MTIIKFPQKQVNTPFFEDVLQDGYHIFSLENAKLESYYPNKFPDYPGVLLKDLKIGDVVTIRVFFKIGTGKNLRIDGGYVDLEIELIEKKSAFAVVKTQLPEGFPLEKGESIELFENEILYKTSTIEH
ncbi:MAG: hypothetical protein P4M12_02595 [Gammaproteobacteria bacterium]|nr:hypothetical protein [Gammaproteobacteria bacterium]MDR3665695.1 hypothetical protein [Ignavibacteriaceae bacterium]